VFGTRNGFVYCLRTDDGRLVWRFRAGPNDQLLFSYEQLESPWPIHGSVLIYDRPSEESPLVYFAAGRSSHLDGGILLYALDLRTGTVRRKANVTMTGQAEGAADVINQRVLPDILSVQNGDLFMRDMRLDMSLMPEQENRPHLYAPNGFLDDTWWHRTYWMYGTTMMSAYGGWPRVGNQVPAGRLLAMDGGPDIYGYGRMAYRAGGGHVHPDATEDYRLFAEVLAPPRKPQAGANGGKRNQPPRRSILWSRSMPFITRSIVLTPDALLVAGGRSLTETAEHHGPGMFWTVSRTDGARQGGCELPAPPIQDGMALTPAGVFISTIDGSVIRLPSTSGSEVAKVIAASIASPQL